MIRLNAGVTVRATTMDTNSASAYAMASGLKNAPDKPSMKNTGMIAKTSISVA